MLTIIIPSYKREYYLNKCVSSIINEINSIELKKNIKIIIILNSNQNYLLKKIENRVKKKKITNQFIFNNTNIGLTGSINKSIKFSDTKYCMILDDEIIVKKGSLKHLLYFLKKNETSILVGKILPYFAKSIPKDNDKKILKNLKKKLKKNKVEKDFTLINFGSKIKKINSKFGFMSMQVFKKKDYIMCGGYGPDGMSGKKTLMNGNGETNFTSCYKSIIYLPSLVGYHAIDNKIQKKYLSKRHFYYGINDSFENIRSKNNFFLMLSLIKFFLYTILFKKTDNRYYYCKGYFLHLLNFFLSGKEFRTYCLRKSYINYNFSKNIKFSLKNKIMPYLW